MRARPVDGQLDAARPDITRAGCPSRPVLEHLTSRWGILVLTILIERPYRFAELRRRVAPVSEKMLAQTLQTLHRDGFVGREAQPTVPPQVTYSLTPLGQQAADQVRALGSWVEAHTHEVLGHQLAHDAARGESG